MKFKILFIGLWLGSVLQAQVLTKKDIPSVLKKLSLEDKVNILVGTGMDIPGFGGMKNHVPWKVPGAAGQSYPVNADIPSVVFSDGPAGVRINPTRKNEPVKTFYATAFPVASLMASTWDINLMQEVGEAFGRESKAYGIDILLAPAMNIQRDPLGGRNFEYYSEDPLLSGKMAAAFVRGVQSEGVGTSIKHFVANNQETNRMKINEIIGQRALREIYLKGFEIAVKEGHPWTVMSSYNKVNGLYTSQNSDLLTTILRKEWGFKGFVMTDWFAGDNAVDQLKAGNDLLMPGIPQQKQAILKAVHDGTLPLKTIDESVKRILSVYIRTLSFKGYKCSNHPDFDKDKLVVRNAAAQGMVLLRNEGHTLPVAKKMKIALLGNAAYETLSGGTGSGDVNKAYMVSIAKGLANAGFSYDMHLESMCRDYIAMEKKKDPIKKSFFIPDKLLPERVWSANEADSLAQRDDMAIYVIGRISGEMFDRKLSDDFYLSDTEKLDLQNLSTAFHKAGKKLVVILNIGGVIETASWKHLADAILLAWQPGQEAGNSVAMVLDGNVNPSGKLPVTFPLSYKDEPASANFPGTETGDDKPAASPFDAFRGKNAKVEYQEGIFVGYRYYESFPAPVSYPFGFGLSYTQFRFSDFSMQRLPDGSVRVQCAITNTGPVAGKEVAEVYLSAPDGILKKPAKELKSFAKTRLLKPGETQKIDFLLTPYQMASFDTYNSSWITEKGTYKISIGSSVDDLPLSGTFSLKKTAIVLKTDNVLKPSTHIEPLFK